jgi:IS1 family transposase
LVEGSSVRSVARLTGSGKNTVLRLLADVGQFCELYQHFALRRLPCTRVEADEVWGFVGAKQKNAKAHHQGDLWTYTAICADSKLLICWLIGPRSKWATRAFVRNLASRLGNRIQLTTDGLHWYDQAVRLAFGPGGCDYAQIVKIYGSPDGVSESPTARRYSPAICTGATKQWRMGNPDMSKCSTSYVERSNLSIRQGMRRMARLTNAFSKKVENHHHAFALHAMHFNYCRPHGTLTKKYGKPTTPAMASGLARSVWTVEQMLQRMDAIFVL